MRQWTTRPWLRHLRPLALGACALLGAGDLVADEEAARHGQRMYRHGVDRDDRELKAWVGPGANLSGSLIACAKCHGVSGRGNERDAGLQAPSLRWATLERARPAGQGLLPRPAYDEVMLLRALRSGIDSGGRPLAAGMPRFELSPRAAADLIHHLRRIGTDRDSQPGIGVDRVRIGTVLPRTLGSAPAGKALVAGLRGCLDKANRQGGVHGRRLELAVFETDAEDVKVMPPWIDQVAMLVAPWWPEGSAADLSRLLGPLPVLGPLGAAAELDGASDDWFGVAPAAADQVRVAVDVVAAVQPKARLLVLADATILGRSGVRAAQAQAQVYPGLALESLDAAEFLAREPAARLHTLEPVTAVLVLDLPEALKAVAETASGAAGAPLVLALASQAGTRPLGWPAPLQARLRLVSSSVAEAEFDPSAFEADLKAIGERPQSSALQTLAYASGCSAVEALRQAGRQLDRDSLTLGLQALNRFKTGVTPPLTFGPRQRRGAWQSRLLRVASAERGFVPDSDWRSPRQAD